MKKNIFLNLLFLFVAMTGFSQVTITPSTFTPSDEITITVTFASATCNSMGTAPNAVYMHAGIGTDANAFGYAVVGNWGVDDGIGAMQNTGPGIWSKTLRPSEYFGLNATQITNATKLGMVFRNASGTQTLKKGPSCGDFIFNVGQFQSTLITPQLGSTTILASNSSLNIQASNTNGPANYNLKANGVSINTATGITYAFTHTNITANQNYELEVTQGGFVQIKKFSVMVNPGTETVALPAGLREGINYNPTDATRATLVLDAPFKDFVYVAGSFNNWNPGSNYAMKKDPSSSKFWLEITGLTPGAANSYQYWVVDTTPIPGSPALVKTADPYSTLVLSPFDDPYTPASTYPNMPPYPAGQEREVTVLQTGKTPYNWQVTNFEKPKKEDLIIYELLIRDFDANLSYQNVIDRIGYFKNLGINAIELMPVMEFEGNESWGYNTAFHLALDKHYGTEDKLRELVDLCHQNGIAVILDVALNHAFGRNPMNRMWMNDPDGDGWGGPSSESPYFNMVATHSYSVGNDFNHQQERTKTYVKRTVEHWIKESRIDGFRWDLTKGFTQNATGSDALTNGYQQDRVDVLKEYVDYSWSLDPTHYAIFEHLGSANEEQQWANYRLNETPSKGVMMWGESFTQYKELALGYGTSIASVGHKSRNFAAKRLIGYPESHDKDRIMYEAITYGNPAGTSPFNNLPNALGRMSAIGATSLLVPGPKMIWHFAELGMDDSIYTCEDGVTVNTENDAAAGDCKLARKPQPQWSENWLQDPLRAKIFSDYSRFIKLKINEPVFEGDYEISPNVSLLKQRIYVFNTSLPDSQLKNVVVLANFAVVSQTITPDFPYAGIWYDLMTNEPITVNSTTDLITIPAGQFRVFGNRPSAFLANERFETTSALSLTPNPSSAQFTINANVNKVEIFALTGQLVKSFTAKSLDYQYNISDLNNGIYLVKATDDQNREQTMKLIKQ